MISGYNFDYEEIRYCCVSSNFLALRSDASYEDSNIIAKIYENGTCLYMTGDYGGNYGDCYVPSLGMHGWVDVRYTC